MHPTSLPRGVALAALVIVLLAALAVAPVSAEATVEKSIDIDMPYSDTIEFRDEFYCEGYASHTTAETSSMRYSMSLYLVFAQVQCIDTPEYISGRADRDLIPDKEGYFDVYYQDPTNSENYLPARLQIVKYRNFLGQITSTQIVFYASNWDPGTATGTKRLPLQWDTDDGRSPIYVGITSTPGVAPKYVGASGPANYGAALSIGTGSWSSTAYQIPSCVAVSHKDVQIPFEISYVSDYLISIDVERDGEYSGVEIYDSEGSLVAQDYEFDSKTYIVPKSQFAKLVVIIDEKQYIYKYSQATPPPPSSAGFTLSLNRSEAAVYEPITATLSPAGDAPEYDCVYWNWDSYELHDEAQYRKINGTWCETTYNGTTETYVNTPTTDNPLVQSISFPDEGPNSKISVRVYNLAQSQRLADLSEYVTISGQSSTYWPLWVGVYDGVSGKALLNVNCQITNLNTGETTNQVIQQNYFGENLQLVATDAYKITLSKAGYESRTWDRLTSRTTQISAYLPILADPEHPDQIKIYLTVYDDAGNPVPGATVQISGLPVTLTNSQGKTEIQATANTTYTYTVSKTGYVGVSDSFTTLSTSYWVTVHLTPEGSAVPTTDPAPGETDAPGTTPDYRTIDQKATSALDILFDNVELIAALAGLILVCNMLTWILPGGGRRK